MYDTALEERSPQGETPIEEGYDDAFAPPEAIALVVVRRLSDETDGAVPYDWVIGRARREYELDRAEVERSVECLVREGVLQKVRADRLVVA